MPNIGARSAPTRRRAIGRTKLAAALRLQGKMSDALVELEEARRIDPTYARAYSDAGMILRAEQKLPEAISAYREAVRLDPDSIDAHNGLAMTLANSGKPEEAVAEFREIIRIDPDSTIGYYNLGHVLADLDRDVEVSRRAPRSHPHLSGPLQCALQPGRAVQARGQIR